MVEFYNMFDKSSFFIYVVIINFHQIAWVKVTFVFHTACFKITTSFKIRQGAIYQIPCQNCSALYIGEIGRNFKTRCVEHKRDLYPSNLVKIDDNNINKKTALVKHVVKFDHKINWLGSSILTYEPDFYKCHFLESYFIQKTNSSINDKEGV